MTATSSQPVSGRYRGRDEHTEVELRIDADGPRPTMRVSADYYRDGAYHGSMRIDAAKISFAPDAMSIGGRGTFTWSTRHTTVGVRIPRVPAGGACAPATLSHFTSNGGAGAVYACAFESTSFRRVDLEEAVQRGVEPLRAYDTGALPSGGPSRTPSPVGAFAEAGVELVRIDPPADVDTSSAGPDATWNDAELYVAMQRSFTRLGDAPRWAVWTLHATAHDNPQLFGLMFDRCGPQRQGCAVFYGSIPPATAADRGRHELRTCVHELGHTFNLPHCWQASPAAPSLPSRPDAATWMNYPSNFPGGEPAYWRSFAFRFDDPELVFLRHGFRQSVIMGGVPFLGRAADEGPVTASRPRASRTLRLQLDAPATIALGMPVTVGFLLHARATAGQPVPTALGPRAGTVDVSVAPPAGPAFVFGPLLSHCRGDETVSLTAGDEPLRDAAFIHYGRNGFMFARAGLYRVRARHITLDGSVLLSNVATIRVLAPATPADRAVAELALGDEDVGTLMSLMGSRAPQLQRANDGLDAIIRGFPEHPFADVARVVRAAGLARDDGRRAGAAAARAAQAILRQDVALEARTAEAELPAALDASNAAPLAGRDDELAWLRARWERARRRRRPRHPLGAARGRQAAARCGARACRAASTSSRASGRGARPRKAVAALQARCKGAARRLCSMPSTTLPANRQLEAIVSAARGGDNLAWVELVDRFGRMLHNVARSYGLAFHDVDDAVQATWIKLYEHIDRLRDPSAIAGWLATTCGASRCGCCRRTSASTSPTIPSSATSAGPEALLLKSERRVVLTRALATLPERQRELMTLIVADGAGSYEQISVTLDMPLGSIGPIRARGLQRLQRHHELREFAAAS